MKSPRFTKGDLVIACPPEDDEKVMMYEVIGAEIKTTGTSHLNYWWYFLSGQSLDKVVTTIKREDVLQRYVTRTQD